MDRRGREREGIDVVVSLGVHVCRHVGVGVSVLVRIDLHIVLAVLIISVCDRTELKNKRTNLHSIMWFIFNLRKNKNSIMVYFTIYSTYIHMYRVEQTQQHSFSNLYQLA
jgi:hypothetical protein